MSANSSLFCIIFYLFCIRPASKESGASAGVLCDVKLKTCIVCSVKFLGGIIVSKRAEREKWLSIIGPKDYSFTEGICFERSRTSFLLSS